MRRLTRPAQLAVVIAVAALVLAGCGGSGASGRSTGHTPAGTGQRSGAGSSTASSPLAPGPSPSAASGGGGSAVHAGVSPLDYSFVSDDEGWLLGRVPCPSATSCDGVVLHTVDGGAHWSRVGTSPFPTAYPCAKPCGSHLWANSIRFADPRHGYLFGQNLAVTDDGGRTWRNADLQSSLLAADGTSVLAVVLNCTTSNGCTPVLERAAVGGAFAPARFPSFAYGNLGWFARQSQTGWLLLGGSKKNALLRSVDDGNTWNAQQVPCPSAEGADLLASTGPNVLWTVCGAGAPAGQRLLISTNAGTSWTNSPTLPRPDPNEGVSDIAPNGTASGYLQPDDNDLLRTSDGGQHWTGSYHARTAADAPFKIGVEDASHAHFLSLHAIHATTNGGRSWSTVTFH